LKLPEIDLVKPKAWDFGATLVLVAAIALAGANLALSSATADVGSISGGASFFFGSVQMILCLLALMVLGKTAVMGTIWGNLAALGACFAGMSGVLLASALWALS